LASTRQHTSPDSDQGLGSAVVFGKMPTRMHPAVGFQLFVLLLAALCISAVEASRPSSSSGDEIHSKGKSYDAETQSGHKHGELCTSRT
jgi:hypothetical protein